MEGDEALLFSDRREMKSQGNTQETTDQDCSGCGQSLDSSLREDVAGIPYCAFCAPVARSQYERIQAGQRQAKELETHERGILAEHRHHAELSNLHEGILKTEAMGRQGLSYVEGAFVFSLWRFSDKSPLILGAFLGFLFADATVWVLKAFFEIPRKRIQPFVELVIYMLLFHLWHSSGGAMPDDPSARAVIWLCFGPVFLIKMVPYALARMHGSGFWGENPHAPDDGHGD
jgi:hypothetical protein